MDNVSVVQARERTGERIHPATNTKVAHRKNGFSPAIINLITEGGFDFFRYVKSLGMSKEDNLIVLSSRHHYYYDESDMKNVRVLVNLKKLNMIKHLDLFLNSLVRILPPETTFIGYFSESRSGQGRKFNFDMLFRFFSRIENLLDPRTESGIKRNEVSEMLERNGFRIVDMTSMNGNTYFYSRYSRRPVDWN